MKRGRLLVIVGALLVLGLGGAAFVWYSGDSGPSDDPKALEAIVRFAAPLKLARWEVFATPEANFIPGPTDYVSVVAIVQADGALPGSVSESGPMVVPNADRAWLPEDASALIHDLQRKKCRVIEIEVGSEHTRSTAWACAVSAGTLIYAIVERRS